MKEAPNFIIQEFVDRATYKKYGKHSIWFFDPRLPIIAQEIKNDLTKKYKRTVYVTINNWSYGGKRQWSCLRTVKYIIGQLKRGIKTAMLTQHVGGQANAIDFKAWYRDDNSKIVYISSNDIRALILDNETKYMKLGVTTLEHGDIAPTWVHLDLRYTGIDEISIFGAKK